MFGSGKQGIFARSWLFAVDVDRLWIQPERAIKGIVFAFFITDLKLRVGVIDLTIFDGQVEMRLGTLANTDPTTKIRGGLEGKIHRQRRIWSCPMSATGSATMAGGFADPERVRGLQCRGSALRWLAQLNGGSQLRHRHCVPLRRLSVLSRSADRGRVLHPPLEMSGRLSAASSPAVD